MTRLAPILLMLLALAASSCNGDDAPSQEEFAEQANEICREAEQSLDDLGEGADGPEDIIEAIDKLIAEARNAVAELGELERPEGDAGERAEQFVDATRSEIEAKGIPALEELRAAVEGEDREAIREAAQRLRRIDSSATNTAAREIGATACGD